MGQRISRAKKTLSAAHAEFELPTGPERTRRLDDVMAVIYLIFNEGYTATAGEDWMRPTSRARRRGSRACWSPSLPTSPRCSACRRCWRSRARGWRARLDEHGAPVLLEAQDRTQWDRC